MVSVKVTKKGRITIPIDLRRKLRISRACRLEVEAEGNVLKVSNLDAKKLLTSDDPIWQLIGRSASGTKGASVQHDRHLAEGERKRWRKR